MTDNTRSDQPSWREDAVRLVLAFADARRVIEIVTGLEESTKVYDAWTAVRERGNSAPDFTIVIPSFSAGEQLAVRVDLRSVVSIETQRVRSVRRGTRRLPSI